MVNDRIKLMKKNLSPKIVSCLCGGIKIKVKGKLRHVINCHCSQCMKTHGNYAAYTACPKENITYIKKRTLKWYVSSKIAKRGFCVTCGGSMFYKLLNSNNISIAAGMFNNSTKLKTYSNIFTKGKLDYYKLDSRISKFYRNSK